MKICTHDRYVQASLLLMVGLMAATAEEPTPSRGAAVNFSAPKADSISTNLSDLRTPASPFQNLESTLKSPFDSMNSPGKQPTFRESRRIMEQHQSLNKKSVKDSLNERAEQMFLDPDSAKGDQGEEAFFQLSKDSLDPYKKKPKNSLERYSDRQERDRLIQTNQANTKNLFNDKNAGLIGSTKFDGQKIRPLRADYADGDRSRSLNPYPRVNLSSNDTAMATRDLGSRSSELFPNSIESPIVHRRSDADTRMEDFKRLLEGSRYVSPAPGAQSPNPSSAANYGTTAYGNDSSLRARSVPASTTSGWSAGQPTSKVNVRDDFATSAGLVGKLEKLQSVPEFPAATKTLAPITTPAYTPVPVKKPTISTFKIPQRGI